MLRIERCWEPDGGHEPESPLRPAQNRARGLLLDAIAPRFRRGLVARLLDEEVAAGRVVCEEGRFRLVAGALDAETAAALRGLEG